MKRQLQNDFVFKVNLAIKKVHNTTGIEIHVMRVNVAINNA